MAHTSEKRWGTASKDISRLCQSFITVVNQGEEAFQQLQEVFTYAGGTDADLAFLLFKEDIEGRGDTVANAEELAKATDAKNAMTAMHDLYLAMNNTVVSQEDRATALRRMI